MAKTFEIYKTPVVTFHSLDQDLVNKQYKSSLRFIFYLLAALISPTCIVFGSFGTYWDLVDFSDCLLTLPVARGPFPSQEHLAELS